MFKTLKIEPNKYMFVILLLSVSSINSKSFLKLFLLIAGTIILAYLGCKFLVNSMLTVSKNLKIWIVGLVLTIKAALEIWRIHAPIERRLIAIILIVLTSWIGLLFYYFYGKARMPQWLGTGVQKY